MFLLLFISIFNTVNLLKELFKVECYSVLVICCTTLRGNVLLVPITAMQPRKKRKT